MTKNFYHAFEECHRGPRDLIKQRIKAYLPYIEVLKGVYPDSPVLDLGCGRGEWLELMDEASVSAFGVDIDGSMLQECHERGLKAEQCDAVTFLQGQPTNSYMAITAFHVVEHVSFEDLLVLIRESLRILKPGGLLILETPNPENITVATKNFYLDPTHLRPLPPALLSFLPEYCGFFRNRIMRMQESVDVLNKPVTTLFDVFNAASPDYAVIAQKEASAEVVQRFDSLFLTPFGIDSDSLAHRFDGQIEQLVQQAKSAEQQAKSAEQQAKSAEQQANSAEQKAKSVELQGRAATQTAIDAERRSKAAEQQALATEQRVCELEQRLMQTQIQLDAIYLSRSWRLTAPLRSAGHYIRWFKAGARAWLTFAPMSRPYRILSKIVAYGTETLNQRPYLKAVVKRMLEPFPRVRRFLSSLEEPVVESSCLIEEIENLSASNIDLPPMAQRIFKDFETAIRNRRKG